MAKSAGAKAAASPIARGSDAETERIARLFEQLPGLVKADGDLVRRGRFLSTDFKIGVGALPLIVTIERGEVLSVTRGPFLLRPWVFALTAAPDTWGQLLEAVPKAGVHDVMALSKVGMLTIEGNLQPFMANLQYVKDVICAPRAMNR